MPKTGYSKKLKLCRYWKLDLSRTKIKITESKSQKVIHTSERRQLVTQNISLKNKRRWAILLKIKLNKLRNNFKFCAKYQISYNYLHINAKKYL